MNNTVAIIPARSGSKTLTDKNIKSLSGHPLIAYSIAAAKLSKKIDRVIVSTNSQEYAAIAQHYGAEVPFIRPDLFSSDASTDREFLIHAMNWLNDNENQIPEYWVHLRPTTPLRNIEVIDKAIESIQNDKKSTSLRSGHVAPESPLKWLKKNGQYFEGFLNDEGFNLPKEAFDKVYVPDGYVDIIKSSFILNSKEIHGSFMIGFESPVCVEVDSLEEFNYIEYQLNQHNSELLSYLDTFDSYYGN